MPAPGLIRELRPLPTALPHPRTRRRRVHTATLETAQAAGVAEEMIVGAEAEEELPAEATEAIEALIRQIN